MLFNSIDFAVFLPLVFIFYWFVFAKSLKVQNTFLLFASYVFYGWWDWRFLALIAFSSFLDFVIGQKLYRESQPNKRKLLVWLSVLSNLGLLGFFKYYNFFLSNFKSAFSIFGLEIGAEPLQIILPVGISFYTFQTLSYTLDIYKGKLKPTSDLISFLAFVSFFPQLVAGPIERAASLLPQFSRQRVFNYAKAVDGMRQILWGLFKKMVIADNCANIANQTFNNTQDYNGSALVIGAIFFTIQIYADFSGYSDIAIGTARLFGFNLMKNFSFPYFSRNIPEAWRKWHISLTTWFRDYLYLPLALKHRNSKLGLVLILFLQFVAIGFWHGANWTFIAWGAIHATYMLPYVLFRKYTIQYTGVVASKGLFPSPFELIQMLKVFVLTSFSMIFFRAESLGHVAIYLSEIFDLSFFEAPNLIGGKRLLGIFILTILFFTLEWLARRDDHGLEKFGLRWKRPIRWAFYILICLLLSYFGGVREDFIYFDF